MMGEKGQIRAVGGKLLKLTAIIKIKQSNVTPHPVGVGLTYFVNDNNRGGSVVKVKGVVGG